jgi:PhnB protein
MASVKPVPDGYHTVTPYLCVDGAGPAIEFYKSVFGAAEVFRMPDPAGKVRHAEIQIGDSRVMLADEYPDIGFRAPRSTGGTPVLIHLYVEDVDAVFNRAVAGGARVINQVADHFYGDRGGSIEDPYGHRWYIATHKEDLSLEQIEARAASSEDAA